MIKLFREFKEWNSEFRHVKDFSYDDDEKKLLGIIKHIIKKEFGDGISVADFFINSNRLVKFFYYLFYNNKKDFNKTISELKKYFDTVNELYKNGGDLYRFLILNSPDELEKEHLGDYWTIYNDRVHIENLGIGLSTDNENEWVSDEEIPDKWFLVTAHTPSGNISVDGVNLEDFFTEAEVSINNPKFLIFKSIVEIDQNF